MRDILFRAKRRDNGEWVEGYLFDDGFENGRIFVGGLVIEEYHGTACDEWSVTGIDFYEVDPDTICQYTGFTDMNGQKIWENDILCGHLDESYPDDKTYAQVLWNKNGWYTKENDGIDYHLMDEFDEHFFATVGNIFDNSELMYIEQ